MWDRLKEGESFDSVGIVIIESSESVWKEEEVTIYSSDFRIVTVDSSVLIDRLATVRL